MPNPRKAAHTEKITTRWTPNQIVQIQAVAQYEAWTPAEAVRKMTLGYIGYLKKNRPDMIKDMVEGYIPPNKESTNIRKGGGAYSTAYKFDRSAVITRLPAAEERTRWRAGKRNAQMEGATTGLTVGEYTAKGGRMRHLNRFINEGWISIDPHHTEE